MDGSMDVVRGSDASIEHMPSGGCRCAVALGTSRRTQGWVTIRWGLALVGATLGRRRHR